MPEPMPHKNTPTAAITPAIHRGYIEGYYGRLLSWQDRSFLLAHLSALPCDAYLYAPKEDIYHRRQWRTPYDADFIAHFSAFTAEARQADIRVLAGIAPTSSPHQSRRTALAGFRSQQAPFFDRKIGVEQSRREALGRNLQHFGSSTSGNHRSISVHCRIRPSRRCR